MEDQEVKTTVSINAVKIEGDILSNMVEQISSCKKLLQVMAFVMKFVKRMKKLSADGNESIGLTIERYEIIRSHSIATLLRNRI